MTTGPTTVLHVDDDESFRQLTRTFLERIDADLDVVSAPSATDGLARLESEDVDCVVSDYDMPETDGLDLLAAVRERDGDLPFILFTGKGSEEIASRAISAGVSDYIQKRGKKEQFELLVNRVENLAEKYRAERRVRRVYEAIDVVDVGVSLLDPDGTFLYVNRAYAELFAYERDELIGEHCAALYPSVEDFERAEATVGDHFEEGRRWHGRTVNVRKDGSKVRIDHTLAITSDDTVVCLMRDPVELDGPGASGDAARGGVASDGV